MDLKRISSKTNRKIKSIIHLNLAAYSYGMHRSFNNRKPDTFKNQGNMMWIGLCRSNRKSDNSNLNLIDYIVLSKEVSYILVTTQGIYTIKHIITN